MRQLRTIDLAHAVPFGGRGRRTPATLLVLDERDRYLIEAARAHFSGLSHQTARSLRSRLLVYRQGRWRRSCSEVWNPHPAERIEAVLWMLLRVRDAIPSERTIRAVLARSIELVDVARIISRASCVVS
jgi:hypothetical protein